MAYRNLQEFIARLEAAGELVRIPQPVSPLLEITEIADRMMKSPQGGKALLFEKVEGSAFPVLINAFGSSKRLALALSDEPDVLAGRLRDILEQAPPGSLWEKISMIPKALSWTRFLPGAYRRKNPPCQEVVYTGDAVDLSILPVLKCWPDDGGRFVTLPVVFTQSLHDGKPNAGMYRLQIYDRNTTGMHWHIHKDGSHYFQEYKKAGRRMQVAVAIGADPVVTYAATAPMPRGINEMLLAGFIRKRPVEMVRALTVDIKVPAEAEFILEGYVDPDETRLEGPFGDHTGYYSLADQYPVLHVTAITHRRNPVYSTTVVGRPPMEDCYLAYATERIFLPLLRTVMPEVKDYCLPWEGVFHNIVVVAIEKEFPGHAAKVMSGLWGSGQMSFAKAIVLVDDAQLLKKGGKLFRYLLDTIDLRADITITEGILDVLDHSAPKGLYGSKIGVDATARLAGETPREPSGIKSDPARLAGSPHGVQALSPGITAVRLLHADCRNPLMLAGVKKDQQKNSLYYRELFAEQSVFQGILVLYDDGANLADDSYVLWKAFNNIDPRRDIQLLPWGALVDATKKGPVDGHAREWPDDIAMSPEIAALVDEKFPQYKKG